MPMDIIMVSVRLSLRPRLKPTPIFFMVDIIVTILDMPDIMDIPMPIMASVRLNLRPRLKLTLIFSMVDTMDITWDMLDTMDMLDTLMLTGDKYGLSKSSTCHRNTTMNKYLDLLPST